jgi:maltose O-acetyltransferase
MVDFVRGGHKINAAVGWRHHMLDTNRQMSDKVRIESVGPSLTEPVRPKKAGRMFRAIDRYALRVLFWLTSLPIFTPDLRSTLLRAIGCVIGKNSVLMSGCFIGSRRIELGDNVFVNVGCFLDGGGLLAIGDFVRVGPHAKFLTGTHPIESSVIRCKAGNDIGARTVIARGCWIGMGAMVLAGVHVAEGCVVAAGAVVTKNTEPHGLYAGVPARRIRDLPLDDGLPSREGIG